MKEVNIFIASVVGILVFVLALGWIVQGNDFFMYKMFAPAYANVQRETFENTKSYNQGIIQELQNMQFQYVQADPEHQDALASLILRRAADYDLDKLPQDLRSFILKLRRDRTSPTGAR